MAPNDVVKYSHPIDEEERKLRFRLLEIHDDAENPRARNPTDLRLAHQAYRGGCRCRY